MIYGGIFMENKRFEITETEGGMNCRFVKHIGQ